MEKLPPGKPRDQDIWGTFKNNWFSQIFAGFANIGQLLGSIADAFLGRGSFGLGPLKEINDRGILDHRIWKPDRELGERHTYWRDNPGVGVHWRSGPGFIP